MKPCKSHQQQIALLAVQALNESETARVLEHINKCAACRAYAKEVECVVSLYVQDAERPVAAGVTARQARLALPEPVPWYGGAALAAAAVLVVCTVLLVMNRTPNRDVVPAVATVAPKSPMVPSIGNSRHLTAADLEELTRPEPVRSSPKADFVFSVKTRDDGS